MLEVQIVLALLVVVAILVILSRKLKIPYPVMLVVGGVVLAFVPGLPTITLKPEIVFLLFLPPLLYWESLTSSLRDLQRNARAISLLAVGLVLTTTLLVGCIAHSFFPGLSWAAAFVLGSVLAPTDEAAVTEVASLLTIPRRIMTILEGESLVNDGISLVAYRMAVAALVTGAFSLKEATWQFLLIGVGGVAIGLGVGWGIAYLRRFLSDDPSIEVTISLLTPFASYLPADALSVSGVLAVITTGLYLGRVGPRIVGPRTRLQTGALWETITFLLNGLLFILTGMQLRTILHSSVRPSVLIVGYAGLILVTIVVVRMVWVFIFTYLPLMLDRSRNKDPLPRWQSAFLIGWVGIRGGLSLVTALAIPLTIGHGKLFPGRDLIICISYLVICATLLTQGLSLSWLIHRLKLTDDSVDRQEEHRARLAAARASLDHLEKVLHRQRHKAGDEANADAHMTELLQDMHAHHVARTKHLDAQAAGALESKFIANKDAYVRLRQELIDAERETVIRMRDNGEINDDVMRTIQRDLDLDSLRLNDTMPT